MNLRLGAIGRLLFLVTIMLVVVAVHLGRGASRPVPQGLPRHPAHPRYHVFSGYLFADDYPRQGRVLDTETGAVTLLAPMAERVFDSVSCSPWQDAGGRYHLTGRLSSPQEGQFDGSSGEFGIARYSFPDGQFLDRISFNLVVAGHPCWFPDGSDRILFAACDGRLHELALAGDLRLENSVTAIEPRRIRWKAAAPRRGPVFIQEPCWPAGTALGGRLVAALRFRGNDPGRTGWLRLWWLQLGPEGTAVVAAGRLVAPSAEHSSALERDERFPSVGMTSDGVPMLAYQVFPRGNPPGELWIAPIVFEPGKAGQVPRVNSRDARLLATTCVAAAPVFSPDGRLIYAAVRDTASGEVRVKRFAIARADQAAPSS